tara:strand:- start:876 stop:1175 length:300 start_codon:yes stop_codon:yes gene_type:complete
MIIFILRNKNKIKYILYLYKMNFKLENHVLVFLTAILFFCLYNKMFEGLQSKCCKLDIECNEGQVCNTHLRPGDDCFALEHPSGKCVDEEKGTLYRVPN